ncbi:hypothetical protein K437DRAFT_257152, partial [Tilletiaria anomala UBC 951]
MYTPTVMSRNLTVLVAIDLYRTTGQSPSLLILLYLLVSPATGCLISPVELSIWAVWRDIQKS